MSEVPPSELTDEQLVGRINDNLAQLNPPADIRALLDAALNELVRRWHTPVELPVPPVVAPPPAEPAVGNSLV